MSSALHTLCREVRELHAAGVLSDLDVYLAEAVLRIEGDERAAPAAQLAMALASRAVEEAHVCLDLSQVTPDWIAALHPDRDRGAVPRSDAVQPLCESLSDPARRKKAFATCGGAVGGPADRRPFVLDGDRLYLRRYWEYEKQVARRLIELARPAEPGAARISKKTEVLVTALLDKEPQQRAARMALTRRLTVITGGPGTGKTYTAARILALLTQTATDQGGTLRIRIAAPTGKAAARMDESLRIARVELTGKTVAFGAPLDAACTVERLLGFRPDSPYFRHTRDNPLDADVVLIDEASMVDLPKMAKLLDALAPETRLVLLGDMHQLASVEVGCVLAAICRSARMKDTVVELAESVRFNRDTPLGRLSLAVNGADDPARARDAWQALRECPVGPGGQRLLRHHETPEFLATATGEVVGDFAQSVLAGYREFLAANDAAAAFKALERFRVLCALRRGPLGSEQVNSIIEGVLFPGAAREEFYRRRIIMVTENDYTLQLFNGDVGVVLPGPDGSLAVFFPRARAGGAGETAYRRVPPRMLPPHVTAFAMTIHKAQGSEFDSILVLMPNRDSPLLTRELVYTAITRSRGRVEVWCGESVFVSAIQKPIRRFTGLEGQLARLDY